MSRRLLSLLLCLAPAAHAQELPPLEDELPTRSSPEAVAAAKYPLTLVLVGNTRFEAQEIRHALLDQVESIEAEGLSPALADDTAFFLSVFYRKYGYANAEVAWAIAPGGVLKLTIREGVFTEVGGTAFVGNEAVSARTLYDLLFASTYERDPRAKILPYVEADILSGVERIRGYYLSEGYLDSEVTGADVTFSADQSKAYLNLPIHEGRQYRFGELAFSGDLLPPDQLEALRAELAPLAARPYTAQGVVTLERKVLYFYRTHGYFKANVRAEADPTRAVGGAIPVHFTIEAGSVYRFDGVTVTGLERLRPTVLTNRFRSLQGRTYHPERVERRYRALMATGLFAELQLKQTTLPNDEVRLDFRAKEAKSRELGFSVGYGTLEGAIIGTRYLDRNLFGMGRPISSNIEVAQNLLRGEILYTDPWLLETRYTLRLRLYGLSQTFKDYSKVEYGFRPELTRKFGRNVEASLFLLTRAVGITNTGGIDEADLGSTEYISSSIGFSVTFDYRDNILNPTRGWVVNATTDFASPVFGSSIDFLRATGRISYYLPIGRTLFAFGLRGGVIFPLGRADELPIDERFFNGGSRSVRSYVERSLGPKDRGGHSIGGQTFTTFNIEYDFPIRGDLYGAAFFDAGSVSRTVGDGLGVTGLAVGLGLRYKTPIGPIRLDYGHNPVRGKNEPSGAWNFSFGFAF